MKAWAEASSLKLMVVNLYFLLVVGELRRYLCDGFEELIHVSRDIVDLMGLG